MKKDKNKAKAFIADVLNDMTPANCLHYLDWRSKLTRALGELNDSDKSMYNTNW